MRDYLFKLWVNDDVVFSEYGNMEAKANVFRKYKEWKSYGLDKVIEVRRDGVVIS